MENALFFGGNLLRWKYKVEGKQGQTQGGVTGNCRRFASQCGGYRRNGGIYENRKY